MKRMLQTTLALWLALAVGSIVWRMLSRRRSLPCPSWMGVLLENPFTNSVSGPRVLQLAGVERGQRMLDAGAGIGRLTIPASERVGPEGRVTALDIQPGMIRRLEQRLREKGIHNVTTILGGLGEGLLPAESFDRAIMVTVLGEIPDREGALREMYSALRPGGILAVTEMLPDPHFEFQGTVRRLAEAAGFDVGDVYGYPVAYTMTLRKPIRL